MTNITSKKLVKKLMATIGHEYVLGGITDETLDLAGKLYRSLESDEERLIRIKKFGDVTEEALKAAVKYRKVEAV
jgi:hypothetical protein